MVEINREMLVTKKAEVDDLDEQLDSATGGQSAGKRAVTNRLVESTKSDWEPVVEQVGNYLRSLVDEDEFAGVFAGVRANLLGDKELSGRFDAVLESKAEEIKASTPSFTEEQIKEIAESRRVAAKQFNQVAELLTLFGIDVTTKESPNYVEPPKRRTGAHGKRGPRQISLYSWSVDGVRMAPKEDTLAGVASANEYESVKSLREALDEFLGAIEVPEKTEKFSVKNPPDPIEFEMANGKTLVGEKRVEASPADTGEDEEDEEDEETPEDS